MNCQGCHLLPSPHTSLSLIFSYQAMKYLHNRGIIHGRLKSRNCVVDGRFVLKVTDYGFSEIINCQNIILEDTKPEGMCNTCANWKNMRWETWHRSSHHLLLLFLYIYIQYFWLALISVSLVQINSGQLQRSCGILNWRRRGRMQLMYTAFLLSCRRWSLAVRPFACWICLLKVRHSHIPIYYPIPLRFSPG